MRNKKLGYAILGILFALISIISIAIPNDKTGTFWLVYVFTVIAICVQPFVWKISFGKEDTLKSKFLGLPVIHVGIVYLIVQLIALAVFMAVPMLPLWCAIVTCAAILGIFAIFMIGGEVGRAEIERVEEKIQKKVFFIKELQVDVELLADREGDADIKAALQKLAEKIRFSDPMSNNALEEIEGAIITKVNEFKTSSDKMIIIEELNLLLEERNKKCKLLK